MVSVLNLMFEIKIYNCIHNQTCPVNAHFAHSICANVQPCLLAPSSSSSSSSLTANSGEQPDQPGEEKQRTGEPNGKAHPDLSTG